MAAQKKTKIAESSQKCEFVAAFKTFDIIFRFFSFQPTSSVSTFKGFTDKLFFVLLVAPFWSPVYNLLRSTHTYVT